MSSRSPALLKPTLALLAVLALVACKDGNGGGQAFCDQVCDNIADECAPLDVRVDCVEQCEVELRSRSFENGEETCLECCINVVLPANKCTDVCASEIGFAICLDDTNVCDPECEDEIDDIANPMCTI